MVRTARRSTYTLRRASSVVLALISVLPLLLFVYTISALEALHLRVAQIGLGSALVLSMIGFYIYSIMMSRLADILLEIEAGVAARAPQSPEVAMAGAPRPSAPPVGHHAENGWRPSGGAISGQSHPVSVAGRPGAGGGGGLIIPGIGRITEIAPAGANALTELGSMWRAEAKPLLRRRVLVAVRDTPDPIRGILAQVARDGVVIDRAGSKTGISYARLSAIEADTAPDFPA